ncbi:hypothetical protein AGMMS50230_04830 [Spirochaetia bacterium]|nr:hypothetical protein AGMMS50230_04830 [Spirochaetia bacterium]
MRPDSKKLNPSYFNFLCNATCFIEQVNSFVKGTGLPRLSIRNLLKTIGIFPPLSEQQAIATHLDKKCSAIDKIIAERQDLIEKLTEYKKSLIYEAVTGKMEIE